VTATHSCRHTACYHTTCHHRFPHRFCTHFPSVLLPRAGVTSLGSRITISVCVDQRACVWVATYPSCAGPSKLAKIEKFKTKVLDEDAFFALLTSRKAQVGDVTHLTLESLRWPAPVHHPLLVDVFWLHELRGGSPQCHELRGGSPQCPTQCASISDVGKGVHSTSLHSRRFVPPVLDSRWFLTFAGDLRL
jgi:hypothetical protein